MNRRLCLFAFLLASFISSAAERLPRLDLLKFRDSEGKVQAVKTPADWAKRRAEILKGMVAVMGPLPGKERRVDLAVQVEEEVDAGKYIHHRPRVKQPRLGFSKLWQSPNLTRLIRINCRP